LTAFAKAPQLPPKKGGFKACLHQAMRSTVFEESLFHLPLSAVLQRLWLTLESACELDNSPGELANSSREIGISLRDLCISLGELGSSLPELANLLRKLANSLRESASSFFRLC